MELLYEADLNNRAARGLFVNRHSSNRFVYIDQMESEVTVNALPFAAPDQVIPRMKVARRTPALVEMAAARQKQRQTDASDRANAEPALPAPAAQPGKFEGQKAALLGVTH